jgi:hypothetical protein
MNSFSVVLAFCFCFKSVCEKCVFSLFNSRIENEIEEPQKEDEDKENKAQNLEKKPPGCQKRRRSIKPRSFKPHHWVFRQFPKTKN